MVGVSLILGFEFVGLMLLQSGVSASIGFLVALIPTPYNFWVLVPIWRSAGRYDGRPIWRWLARITVVVWIFGTFEGIWIVAQEFGLA